MSDVAELIDRQDSQTFIDEAMRMIEDAAVSGGDLDPMVVNQSALAGAFADLLSSLSARIAELERERDVMAESRNFTLSDHQRLLRRSDVEGICDSIGSCFEDPDGVARCGPCAIKAAEAVGVGVRYSIPHAPQEARLGRELRAAEAKLAKAEEALRNIGNVHRELPLIEALASDYLTGRILKCRETADAVLAEIKGGE